jgi:hypothetical protein
MAMVVKLNIGDWKIGDLGVVAVLPVDLRLIFASSTLCSKQQLGLIAVLIFSMPIIGCDCLQLYFLTIIYCSCCKLCRVS